MLREGWGQSKRDIQQSMCPQTCSPWACGLVLWAPAALGILSSRPDTFSTDDLCLGLTPLRFPLADFPWFWHLWTFLDSPLWLKFHLLNFMQWPWRAFLQGVNPSTTLPALSSFLNLWCPSCFSIFHAYKSSAVCMMLQFCWLQV